MKELNDKTSRSFERSRIVEPGKGTLVPKIAGGVSKVEVKSELVLFQADSAAPPGRAET